MFRLLAVAVVGSALLPDAPWGAGQADSDPHRVSLAQFYKVPGR